MGRDSEGELRKQLLWRMLPGTRLLFTLHTSRQAEHNHTNTNKTA